MSGAFSRAPAFWWRKGLSWQSLLLAIPGLIYGRITGQRMKAAPSGTSAIPVICVGNFVLGGAGKTPFSIALARALEAQGLRPGFLLRGYGGREKGPLLVDLDLHSASDVGDEALLLAEVAPTVVSADRVAGARFAASLADPVAIDILLMDDGFQNPALRKDLSLVLVDAATGLGNGLCFPAGPLRAPLRQQIVHADALVLVGEGMAADEVVHQAARRGLPLYHARIEARPEAGLTDRPVLAFAGIGRPEKFFASLESCGCTLACKVAFPDHHAFSEAETEKLLLEAEREDWQLVTTAKDMARLRTATGEIHRWLSARTKVLPVEMVIDQQARLLGQINEMRRLRVFRQAPSAGSSSGDPA